MVAHLLQARPQGCCLGKRGLFVAAGSKSTAPHTSAQCCAVCMAHDLHACCACMMVLGQGPLALALLDTGGA